MLKVKSTVNSHRIVVVCNNDCLSVILYFTYSFLFIRTKNLSTLDIYLSQCIFFKEPNYMFISQGCKEGAALIVAYKLSQLDFVRSSTKVPRREHPFSCFWLQVARHEGRRQSSFWHKIRDSFLSPTENYS